MRRWIGALAIGVVVAATTGVPTVRADHHPASAVPWDFEADGYADPVIAAPDPDGRGDDRLVVLAGSRTGVAARGARTWGHSRLLPPDAPIRSLDGLGSSLASADFDQDGYADLAVAAQSGREPWPGIGVISIVYGAAGGLSRRVELRTPRDPGLPDEYGLGIDLATGDVDGDGYPDLVSGAIRLPFPDSTAREGAVVVFPGGEGGLGAPYQSEAGLVLVLRGSPAGPTAVGASAWSMATPGIRGLATRRDRFGSQVGG